MQPCIVGVLVAVVPVLGISWLGFPLQQGCWFAYLETLLYMEIKDNLERLNSVWREKGEESREITFICEALCERPSEGCLCLIWYQFSFFPGEGDGFWKNACRKSGCGRQQRILECFQSVAFPREAGLQRCGPVTKGSVSHRVCLPSHSWHNWWPVVRAYTFTWSF